MKLYRYRWWFSALRPIRIRASHTPFLDVQRRWYGLNLLVPRTNVLNEFTEGELRVVSGSKFQARVVEGMNELKVDVRRL